MNQISKGLVLNMYKKILSKRTDKEILGDWKEIDSREVTKEVAMVRGWIMDELKKRFPVEFDEWIEYDGDIADYIKL